MKQRQQNSTLYPIPFLMIDSADHVTGKTGLSPTVTISKNGGAFASPSGAITELANGWYVLAGNATDRNTLGEFLIHATAAGADPTDDRYVIVPWDPFDAVKMGLTALPNAVPGANGGLPTTNGTKINQSVDLTAGQSIACSDKSGFSLATAPPTAEQIRAEIDSHSTQLAAILEDTGTTIPALINSDSGAGTIQHTYTLEAPVGTPCADARIYLSTDALKANIIHEGITNALGQVTFNVDLPVGTTVYLWRYKTGVDFVNPDVEEI